MCSEGSPPAQLDAGSLEAVFTAAGRALPTDRPAARPRPTLDRDALERLVVGITGDLHAELASALRAEAQLELARRAPPAPERADAASGTVPPLVRNERTKTVHVVGIGADSDLPACHWQSVCGWAFVQWGGFCVLLLLLLVVVVVGGGGGGNGGVVLVLRCSRNGACTDSRTPSSGGGW